MSDYGQMSSPSTMLAHLQLPPLQLRRDLSRVAMLFKIVNQQVAVSSSPLIPCRGSVSVPADYMTTRGHGQRFLVPHSNNDVHLKSYFPASVRLWNALPASVITASSIEAFKTGAMEAMKGHY